MEVLGPRYRDIKSGAAYRIYNLDVYASTHLRRIHRSTTVAPPTQKAVSSLAASGTVETILPHSCCSCPLNRAEASRPRCSSRAVRWPSSFSISALDFFPFRPTLPSPQRQSPYQSPNPAQQHHPRTPLPRPSRPRQAECMSLVARCESRLPGLDMLFSSGGCCSCGVGEFLSVRALTACSISDLAWRIAARSPPSCSRRPVLCAVTGSAGSNVH
jgi:hypothetical protein